MIDSKKEAKQISIEIQNSWVGHQVNGIEPEIS